MITFSDLFPKIRDRLLLEKQAEILAKIKKPYTCGVREKSRDSLDIVSVKIGKDVKSYLQGAGEPIRGYADGQTVVITAMYKRFLPLLAESLAKMGWIKRIITLLAIKYNFNIFPQWFEYIFWLNQCLLKDEYWCQPVKELRRVFKGKINDNLIDAITLMIEYDSAYRYPLQDALSELNKNNGVIKECCRLLDIIAERYDIRPNNIWQVDKIKKIKLFIRLLLIVSPKTKKLVKDIFKEINIDEIKLSKEDIYWTNQLDIYNYRGMTMQQRRNENIIKYGKNVV